MGLEVPGFVELRMVASLDKSRDEVKVENVLVRGGIPEKDTLKIVSVELAASIACSFDANSRAKEFKTSKVRFEAVVSFERGLLCIRVNQAIV
jgi:hypothetical protein